MPPNRQSSIDTAIQHSEILEGKVQDATDKLALMNEALETEWQSRDDLEEQLATVILDEAAAHVGDVVLQTIADRLRETTRQADTVGRLGR